MALKQLPVYHRLTLRLLLPVVLVGILCSTVLVAYLSSPLKQFLVHQFEANLRLAAVMGTQFCEENFSYLLDLRLEKNEEMNQVMKKEAIEKIKAVSLEFPHIHLMVLESGHVVKGASLEGLPETWQGIDLDGASGKFLECEVDGLKTRCHVQFFPFWDWYIISFVFERDFSRPIQMAYNITYLSAACVFLMILGTLLLFFHLLVKIPISRLVEATAGVAEGRTKKIEKIDTHEIGQLTRAFNHMVDSIEHEKAEVRSLIGQLRESEALFRSQFEYGNIGISISRPDLTWVKSNDRFCRMLGYEERELHEKQWGDLFYAEELNQAEDLVSQLISGDIDNYEIDIRMIQKSGAHIFTHVNVSCLRNQDGSVRYLIASILDISERKQDEEKIRSLRNYLSNIIDSMPSVIIGVDKESCVTLWNNQAVQVTGIYRDAAVGKPLEQAYPMLFTKLPRISEAIRDRRVCSDPRQARKQGHETLYEDITIFPLVANGVEGAVIRVDDVTEQVRLEEMMVQSEKMLSVGGLAAGMAHEINNPLAGMIQTANVMKSRLENIQMPANQKAAEKRGLTMTDISAYMADRGILRMVDAINESGRRVAEIVNNMLSFARKSDAIVSSHRPDILMDQILEVAATDYDLKKQYDFKAIKLVKEYEDYLPVIPCEGAKIQQVFFNILKNGAQAMHDAHQAGGDPPCFVLRILLEKAAKMVRVEIIDNGPGMDEATRSRIFEPFFTTKAVGIGTGLGLSVSYFIITENHYGTMDVKSSPGKGSTFYYPSALERFKRTRLIMASLTKTNPADAAMLLPPDL